MGESCLGKLKDQEVCYIPFKKRGDFVRKDVGHGITRYEETRQPGAERLLCDLGLCAPTPWALVSPSIKWGCNSHPTELLDVNTIWKQLVKYNHYFYFYVLVFWPRGMWDLSSPTRDRTCTPCIGR